MTRTGRPTLTITRKVGASPRYRFTCEHGASILEHRQVHPIEAEPTLLAFHARRWGCRCNEALKDWEDDLLEAAEMGCLERRAMAELDRASRATGMAPTDLARLTARRVMDELFGGAG